MADMKETCMWKAYIGGWVVWPVSDPDKAQKNCHEYRERNEKPWEQRNQVKSMEA